MSEYNRKNTQDISELIEPIVNDAGLFLDGVKLTRAGQHSVLRVTVDLPYGPGGVDSDILESVTRSISALLDDADPISGAYTLEVSTPGAERELHSEREFSRVIGHLAKLSLQTGERIVGRVENITEHELELWTVVKSGKRDVPGPRRTVELADINKARSIVELSKIDFESQEDN